MPYGACGLTQSLAAQALGKVSLSLPINAGARPSPSTDLGQHKGTSLSPPAPQQPPFPMSSSLSGLNFIIMLGQGAAQDITQDVVDIGASRLLCPWEQGRSVGLWAVFGMSKSSHCQIAMSPTGGAAALWMVAFAAVARMQVGKGKDLSRAAVPGEKVSLGAAGLSSGQAPGLPKAECLLVLILAYSGAGHSEQFSVGRAQIPSAGEILPRAAECHGKYFPNAFPRGGSCCAASVRSSRRLQLG